MKVVRPLKAAQRTCGCPSPGSVQCQIGWGSEQSDLEEGVPAQAGRLELADLVRSLPNQDDR